MIPPQDFAGIEIGVASRPRDGQRESGDDYVVRTTGSGVLLAVVDGLGHGPEAGLAARAAALRVSTNVDGHLIPLLTRCHEDLRGTRGAAMSLAEIDFGKNLLRWIAVGNVDGVLLRAEPGARPRTESVVQRNGVVGDRLPPLQDSGLAIAPGDLLVMATDGILPDYRRILAPGVPAQVLADRICARSSRRDDDALVLVCQYHGIPV